MKCDMECPKCEIKFVGQLWHPGKCPGCGQNYFWDERPTDDGDALPEEVWETPGEWK